MVSRTSFDWKSQKQKKQKVEPIQCNNSYKRQLTPKFATQMIISHFTTTKKTSGKQWHKTELTISDASLKSEWTDKASSSVAESKSPDSEVRLA